MSGSTSVPGVSFTARGFVAPAEADVVVGLDADWKAAFGGDLNVDPTTPTGQLIASQAAIIGQSNNQQVALFNGVDPAYASGRMQDAIARIYFIERDPAEPTTLQIICGGLQGVVIPVGALIADASGNLYTCTEAGTIDAGGTVTLSFAAQITGPTAIPAQVGIYQAIPGWNTATVDSGVVGRDVESRADFEFRRAQSVAKNGAGFLPTILGNVLSVSGVIDAYVTENYTGAPVVVGGVTLAANSLYVCVAGGAAQDIGDAIWLKKNPGCAYTGDTSITVQDTNSGYSPPYPEYTVTWQTAVAEATCFNVTITDSVGVPSNALDLIQAAIAAAFTGSDGAARARIGSTLYASRYYGPVALLGAWAQIVSIQLGSEASPTATFTGVIAGTALSTSAETGTIAIGQFVFGTGVASGTYIVSGAGSSWVVSVSQTVASTSMVSVDATANDYTMDIDQIPTLAAGAALPSGAQPDVRLILV